MEDIKQLSSPKFILSELLLPYGFNITSVNDILESCIKGSSGNLFYADEYRIVIDRDIIILEKRVQSENLSAIRINQHDPYVTYGNVTISQNSGSNFPENLQDKNFCHVDADRLVYPLLLRKWELGDKFIPFGMKGFKKISD